MRDTNTGLYEEGTIASLVPEESAVALMALTPEPLRHVNKGRVASRSGKNVSPHDTCTCATSTGLKRSRDCRLIRSYRYMVAM
jgi:hypothetical protein